MRKGTVSAILLLMLMLVACSAPAAPATGTGEEAAPVGEAAPAGEEPVTLTFLTALPPGDGGEMQTLLEEQMARFSEINPDVFVELQIVPSVELAPRMEVMLASGTPLDVIALPPAGAVSLLTENLISDQETNIAADEFLPGALENFRFDGPLSGIPWWRNPNCGFGYTGLSVPVTSGYPELAQQLVSFLTEPEQQIEMFNRSGNLALPTRSNLYEELGIECPENGVILWPAPEEQTQIVEIAQVAVQELQSPLSTNNQQLSSEGISLQDQTFAPERATAAIGQPDPESVEPGRNNDQEGEILTVFAPVSQPLSDADFENALRSEAGVIVAAIIGNSAPLPLLFEDGETVIEPGQTVAVKWRAANDELTAVRVFWVYPDEHEEEVGVAPLERIQTGSNILASPFVAVVIENPCKIWFKYNNYLSSVTVPRAALRGTLWWLSNTGRQVLWYRCT